MLVRCMQGYQHGRILSLQTDANPRINRAHPSHCQVIHENPRYCSVLRSVLSLCYLWSWSTYIQLPRTSHDSVDSVKLVSYVRYFLWCSLGLLAKMLDRCHAHLHSLNTPCRLRTADHMEVLLSLHTPDVLQEKYGIVPTMSQIELPVGVRS